MSFFSPAEVEFYKKFSQISKKKKKNTDVEFYHPNLFYSGGKIEPHCLDQTSFILTETPEVSLFCYLFPVHGCLTLLKVPVWNASIFKSHHPDHTHEFAKLIKPLSKFRGFCQSTIFLVEQEFLSLQFPRFHYEEQITITGEQDLYKVWGMFLERHFDTSTFQRMLSKVEALGQKFDSYEVQDSMEEETLKNLRWKLSREFQKS